MHNIGSRPSWVYRCIAYFWGFSSCIILTKVYSNVVLSMLASPNYLTLVRAIHELPNKPEVTVMFFSDPAQIYIFQYVIYYVLYLYIKTRVNEILNFYQSLVEGDLKTIGDQLRQNPNQKLPNSDVSTAIEAVEGKMAVFLGVRIYQYKKNNLSFKKMMIFSISHSQELFANPF